VDLGDVGPVQRDRDVVIGGERLQDRPVHDVAAIVRIELRHERRVRAEYAVRVHHLRRWPGGNGHGERGRAIAKREPDDLCRGRERDLVARAELRRARVVDPLMQLGIDDRAAKLDVEVARAEG